MAANSGNLLVDSHGQKWAGQVCFDHAGGGGSGLLKMREVALVTFSPSQKLDSHNMH